MRSRAQTIAIILSKYKKKIGNRAFASHTKPRESSFKMPVTGTTSGDPSLPLYRFVGGKKLDQKGTAIHWTHDKHEVEQMATESEGFILTADHPGLQHVLDWENARDRDVMERTIGSYAYRDKVFPEVPIRPNAPIKVRTIERVSINGTRRKIKVVL